MRALQIHGTAKKIQQLVRLSKQALREGAYRVANRLHAVALNMEGRTAPEIADVLKVHRSNVSLWLERWQEEGTEGILEGHRSGRPPNLSEHQRQQLADILESGPVAYGFTSGVWTCPMIARVIEDEFSLSYHPAHVSRILHSLEFSVQRPQKVLARADQALQSKWIRYRYPNLKKKPKAKSGYPLRRRSQLPPRPYALPDLGTSRLAAANPDHGTTKYLENIWHHRALCGSVPLPLPEGLQRRDLHRISRTDAAQLLSSQNLSDPRQCFLPQGQNRLALVFRSSPIYGSLQPAGLFAATQCAGADLAPYSCKWYPQSLFRNPKRAAIGIDFHISQYPEKFPTGARLSAALSIMSRYLCNDI
jgi:transposase